MIPVTNLLSSLQALEKEANDIKHDNEMMLRSTYVGGRGSFQPKFIVAADSPREEDEVQHRPFVGLVGQLLSQALIGARIQEQECWMTTLLKHRPAKNWNTVEFHQSGERHPSQTELKLLNPVIYSEFDMLSPRVILALGATAGEYFSDMPIAITKEHGHLTMWRGYPVVVTYHPAYLLHRGASAREGLLGEIVKDLKQVHNMLDARETHTTF